MGGGAGMTFEEDLPRTVVCIRTGTGSSKSRAFAVSGLADSYLNSIVDA